MIEDSVDIALWYVLRKVHTIVRCELNSCQGHQGQSPRRAHLAVAWRQSPRTGKRLRMVSTQLQLRPLVLQADLSCVQDRRGSTQ